MITLYKTKITPERNAQVDYLEEYLKQCKTSGSIECQYIKNDVDIEVKLDMSQEELENPQYNYAAIQNKDEGRVYYYFIMNMTWVAKHAVKLILSIDSINTFANDLTWSDKTTVIREHRDRFRLNGKTPFLTRIIDDIDEGVVPAKVLYSDSKIIEHGDSNLKWYLMYRTRTTLNVTDVTNPVECFTFANKELILENPSATTEPVTITYHDLEPGKTYYCMYDENGAGEVSAVGPSSVDWTLNTKKIRGVAFSRSVEEGRISAWSISYSDFGGLEHNTTYTKDEIIFTKMTRARIMSTPLAGQISEMLASPSFDILAGVKFTTIRDFKSIDRTDSRILKIIELPYAPFDVTYDSGKDTWIKPEGWGVWDGMFKLEDLNFEFLNHLPEIPLTDFLTEMNITVPSDKLKLPWTPYNPNNESKMFNSNFYTYKIAYDSFSSQVVYERVVDVFKQYPTLKLEFKPSNTINSNLMFKFDIEDATYVKVEDYENYLAAQRNNEVALYSQEYVSYIKNGFNYDRKAKTYSEWQRGISAVSTGAGLVGVAKAALASGGWAIWAAAGAAVITAIGNAVTGYLQEENQWNSKLSQLKAQAATVTGSDDIDLLNYYNGNKLHVLRYRPIPKMREAMEDLFRYAGYATNMKKIPEFNSRCWYNFIQAEVAFTNENSEVLKPFLDDIRSRYSIGVTIYHMLRNDNDIAEWDWNQEYENWENAVIYG